MFNVGDRVKAKVDIFCVYGWMQKGGIVIVDTLRLGNRDFSFMYKGTRVLANFGDFELARKASAAAAAKAIASQPYLTNFPPFVPSKTYSWTGIDDTTGAVPEAPPVKQPSPCECGSAAVGSQFHSTWCPEFKKQNKEN